MNIQQKILVGGALAFPAYAVMFGGAHPSDLVPIFIAVAMICALIYGLWRILFPSPGKAMFCSACGHEGPSKQITKGSTGLELFLWLLFLLPGLVYSIWRHSSRAHGCAACGSTALIPPDSPMAIRQKKTLQG